MPALLTKLNKRPRKKPVGAGFVIPSAGVVAPTVVAEAAQEAVNTRVSSASLTQEILRRSGSTADENVPWWLKSPPAPSRTLDSLVPLAKTILNQQLQGKSFDEEELRRVISRSVQSASQRLPSESSVSQREAEEAVRELYDLVAGKGPLQPLYDDIAVTDIFVDGFDSIKCLRNGQSLETPFKFRSSSEYEGFLANQLTAADRVLDDGHPIVTAVLPDKWRTRIHAMHPSLLDREEPSLVLRIPRLQQPTFYELLRTKTLPATAAAWLSEVVAGGEAHIIVTGPSGSGKTAMVTALLNAISSEERIVTIEELPEIFLQSAQHEKLLTRPYISPEAGAVDLEMILEAAMRRSPKRIALGDIRDSQLGLLRKALDSGLPVIASMVASHYTERVDLMIKMSIRDGRPCLEELVDVKGDVILLAFDSVQDGKRLWRMQTTHSPWMQKLKTQGHELLVGSAVLGCRTE